MVDYILPPFIYCTSDLLREVAKYNFRIYLLLIYGSI